MAQSLNQFEQNFLSVLERLEIKGKRGRIVPILITAEIAEWVKILLEHRHKFIAEDNQYLFANTGNSYHRGCDVLKPLHGRRNTNIFCNQSISYAHIFTRTHASHYFFNYVS